MSFIAGITWLGRGAVLAQWAIIEHSWASWLPWWRRYLSVVIWALMCIADLMVRGRSNFLVNLALFFAACGAHVWNRLTYRRNRDRGDDQRKLEAGRSERLTDVQQASFQRQTMEAG